MLDVYFLEKNKIIIGETYTKRDGKLENFYVKNGYIINDMSKEDFEKNSKKVILEYLNSDKENKAFKKTEINSKKVIDLENFFS